jgi:hypothetical protein
MTGKALARQGSSVSAVHGPVRRAVDEEAAHAADALAAVVVERHRLLALRDEILVQDVQHLEEGHVLVGVDLVPHEAARVLRVLLPPDVEGQPHVAVAVSVRAHL